MSQREVIYSDEGFNIKAFFLKLLNKWYWFAGSVFICVLIAVIFINFYSPKYEVSNVVLIKKDTKDESLTSVFNEQAAPSNRQAASITDQVGIIKSYKVNLKTVQNLNWDISLSEKGVLHDTDLYLSEPFLIEKAKGFAQAETSPVYITPISQDVFQIKVKEVSIDNIKRDVDLTKDVRVNEPFTNLYFNFSIHKIPGVPLKIGQTYILVFNNLNKLANDYKERLDVTPGDEESNLIYIRLESRQPARDVNYLNELANVYIEFGLEEKNKIADNTLRFISNQIVGITDSLQVASKDFTNFRSRNKIVDLGQEASMVVQSLEQIETEEAASKMRLEYYNNLKKYLSDAKQMKDLVAPSVVGITDNTLNALVLKLTDLYSQRELLSYSVQEKNPNLITLDNTIQYTQKILRENIDNLLNNTYGEIRNMEQRKQRVNSTLSSLPKTEQDLVNIKRSFDLNNDLYTFLLRKRAEIGIARASNAADATVLDTARFDAVVPLGPGKIQIILIGFIAGLILPFFALVLLEYFSGKLETLEDVEKQSELSIAGNIFTNRFKTELPVIGHPNSAITESFRSLRANLFHLSHHSDRKVFAIHSTLVGEGKSFLAANLAVSLAINNKKVLLVEGDMRKPKLHMLFKFTRDRGLSTFLTGKLTFHEVVQPTKVTGLFFVAAGLEIAHPSEMLSSDNFEKFVRLAKEEFDYVVIDSVPIGVLSDASRIAKCADINLIVLRLRYSGNSQLRTINKLAAEGIMTNMALVLNDVSDELTKKQLKAYGYE